MAKFIIDLVFNEETGDLQLTVDFNDPSMTALELNEGIQSGEIREDVLHMVEEVFGTELARDIRAGNTEMICLDHDPDGQSASVESEPQSAPERVDWRRENLQ